MMPALKGTTVLTKYYAASLFIAILIWTVLSLLDVEFVNLIFFLTAYVWHFALLAPGLKEKIFAGKNKYSFLSIIIRVNHYLQLFINLKKIPFASGIIRAISPFLFTLLLLVCGGGGNLLFAILGSVSFEILFHAIKRYLSISPLLNTNDQEILPAIPNEENSRE